MSKSALVQTSHFGFKSPKPAPSNATNSQASHSQVTTSGQSGMAKGSGNYFTWDENRRRKLEKVVIEPRPMCICCNRFRLQNGFSQNELTKYREYKLRKQEQPSKTGKPDAPRCMECVGAGQRVELKCHSCDKTLGVDRFSKVQRRTPDTARCVDCVQEHLDLDPTVKESITHYDDQSSTYYGGTSTGYGYTALGNSLSGLHLQSDGTGRVSHPTSTAAGNGSGSGSFHGFPNPNGGTGTASVVGSSASDAGTVSTAAPTWADLYSGQNGQSERGRARVAPKCDDKFAKVKAWKAPKAQPSLAAEEPREVEDDSDDDDGEEWMP